MRTLHDRHVRLAPWIGAVTPDPRQTAYIEHAMNDARSFLWHGEKLMRNWQAARLAPSTLHPLQAG